MIMAKKVSPTKRRVTKAPPKEKKNLSIPLMLGVLIFSIFFFLVYPKYQNFESKREVELKYAYFYCAIQVMNLCSEGETKKAEQFYKEAARIEEKIVNKKTIESTKNKMERSYWVNK